MVARNPTLLHAAQSAWTTSTPKLRRALFAPETMTGFSTEAGLGEPD
ncbi:MAG: hypothetical protein H7345_11675 [Rubritepida sp.]|nr:hypothetical protein [Rubritepida sp.]